MGKHHSFWGYFIYDSADAFWPRKHATNVNDFVLGGRSVGPWLTAFAYGTSYFSAVVFVGYPLQGLSVANNIFSAPCFLRMLRNLSSSIKPNVLPVVTRPEQFDTVNSFAARLNEKYQEQPRHLIRHTYIPHSALLYRHSSKFPEVFLPGGRALPQAHRSAW